MMNCSVCGLTKEGVDVIFENGKYGHRERDLADLDELDRFIQLQGQSFGMTKEAWELGKPCAFCQEKRQTQAPIKFLTGEFSHFACSICEMSEAQKGVNLRDHRVCFRGRDVVKLDELNKKVDDVLNVIQKNGLTDEIRQKLYYLCDERLNHKICQES
jgi:hypothetical protein